MKKYIALAALSATLLSLPANAKTQGHYVGIDWINSKTKNTYTVDGDSSPSKYNDKSSYGIGLNYKYAFNFNDFFVAPGVFFDKLGFGYDSVELQYRLGAKLDLGYDINDKFAVYFTNGFANTNYKYLPNDRSTNKNTTEYMDYFYGIGASYGLTERVSLNVEYSMQNNTALIGEEGFGRVKTDLSLLKIGATYHF